MKVLINALLSPLMYLEKGNFLVQILTSMGITLVISPFFTMIDKVKNFLITDNKFFSVVMVLVFMDLLSGVYKHIKSGTFSYKKMYTGFLEKVFVSTMGMITFGFFSSVHELGSYMDIKTTIILTGKFCNLVYVGGSVFSNLYVISGGEFPPAGWTKNINNFKKTLDIQNFKPKNNKNGK